MPFVCPSWLSVILYNPVRKFFTDREKVLQECGVGPRSIVLEVGAGNGFFTESLAARAEKVYAVELQSGMVKKLQKRVERFGGKVAIVQCDIAACGLGAGETDICFMYYSFHEIANKEGAVEAVSRALRGGGTLVVYEPTVEVSREKMRKTAALFERAGFTTVEERHGLFTRYAKLRKSPA